MASKTDEEGPSFLAAVGSLFGTGPKIAKPSWSAYGKLPLYKDFLRHGLAAPEAQGFRQWLDRGFSRHWDEDEACSSHSIAPHAFSLCFDGLARRLAGCLWGSHDHGELRSFPFTLFVSLPAGSGVGDLSVLRALEEVAQSAGTLRCTLDAAPDVQAFYQRLRESSLTLRLERDKALVARLEKETQGTSIRAFAESLYGADAAAVRWPALLAYLDRRRSASRTRDRDAATPPLACRLPVSPLLPALLQAELWSAFVLGAGAKGKEPLNVLLPWKGEPEGGILILERNLRPDDVFAFHPSPPHYDFVEDLRHAVPGTAAPPPEEGWDLPLSSLLQAGAPRPARG
ncbi:MAG TPA: TagF domain-containing protein [Thermoanaerobaculia bacterium]|nr:TagF domain-containing protein [Thermoanaerobaculia bacterium]